MLEKPENGGPEGQKSTKTSILCSKSPKTRVPDPKSAQKPRFCARNALKWGFRMVKAHKNPDFVLEMPKNRGPEGQKRTKTSILCSKSLKTRVSEGKSAQKCRFCARKDRDWHREEQMWPSCKSPRTLQKRKYLTTRQLTFEAVLDEHKSRPPRTLLK